MTGNIEQRVNLRHAHLLGARGNLDDFLARLDLALFKHTEVEAGPAATGEQGRHPGLVHSDADAVTGHTRLRHLEQRAPDPVAVADANLIIGHTFNGEVLAKLSEAEVIPAKFPLPVMIAIDLVDKDGPMFAAVADQVALSVAVEIERPRHAPARNGALPHRRVNRLSMPRDILWKTDVNRQ